MVRCEPHKLDKGVRFFSPEQNLRGEIGKHNWFRTSTLRVRVSPKVQVVQ